MLLLTHLITPGQSGSVASRRDPTAAVPTPLRLNDAIVKGTHNSYHEEPEGLAAMVALSPRAGAWEYTHAPLATQLTNQSVRALELDVHYSDGALEVYHATLDPKSTCDTLQACLQEIAQWSTAREAHFPLSVWIEIKCEEVCTPEDCAPEVCAPEVCVPFGGCTPGACTPGACTPTTCALGLCDPSDANAAVDAIDAVITSTFPPANRITPADVMG